MRKVHGWRRVLRWVQMTFALVLSAVLLGIGVATGVLQTGWGRELVRSQLEARLGAIFVGGVRVGAVRGNPLSELVVDDVVINGPTRRPAITIRRLHVRLALLPLLSHQLRIDRLEADDVDVVLEKRPAGDYEIEDLTTGPSSSWSIAVRDLRIHRGHVAIDAGKEWIDLDRIELQAAGSVPFEGPIDASASLAATWRQRGAPIRVAADVHAGIHAVEVRSALATVGDVGLAATGVRIPTGDAAKAFGGMVAVRAPANAVAKLAPQLKLPADVAVAIEAMPEGRFTDLAITGDLGGAPLRGFVRADVAAMAGQGVVTAAGLDLGALSGGTLTGPGGGLAALHVAQGGGALPDVQGIVQLWAVLPDAGHTDAAIALTTRGSTIHVTIGAATATGVSAGLAAEVTKHGTAMTLDRGVLVAATPDTRRATGAPLQGTLDGTITAHGVLAPTPDLAITGHLDGRHLAFEGISADALRVRIDARNLPTLPTGTARVELDNVRRYSIALRDLIVTAVSRPDGKVALTVHSDPRPAPFEIDLDALITPIGPRGPHKTIDIDLRRHVVRVAGGSPWHGTSGHIAIGPERIEVRDVRSASHDGSLAANATLGRTTGALDATLEAAVRLDAFSSYRGNVDAHVAVHRASGKLAGSVVANAHGITIDPRSAVALDGSATITVKDRTLQAQLAAHGPCVGSAQLAALVDGPRDVGNAAAWKRLTRTAIRRLDVTLSHLELQAIADLADRTLMGTLDGELHITPGDARGAIAVRGVRGGARDSGVIDGDLELAQTASDELTTTAQARIGQLGSLDLTAKLRLPDKLFDPAAWNKLGPAAIRGATVRSGDIPLDPATLARFGVGAHYRGVASLSADIQPALAGASLVLDLRELRGGPIVAPIAAHLDAMLDAHTLIATGTVRAGGVTLLSVESRIAEPLAQLRLHPEAAPLSATAVIPSVPARALLAVLGNTQLAQGTLDGSIELGGTLGNPTVKLAATARDLTASSAAIRPTQTIQQLQIDGSWDGKTGTLAVIGTETAGGQLHIAAEARQDDLAHARASITATQMDLAPIAAFLPGPASGLAGRLDANMALEGVDPGTAQLAGTLHVSEGRIPIAPEVGTLVQGDLRVAVHDRKIQIALGAKLGKGDVLFAADAPLDGLAPASGHAKLTLHKVKLIGETEAVIDGVVNARLARADGEWTADIDVDSGNVVIPDQKGERLDPVGAPSDLVYPGQRTQPATKARSGTPPRGPLLVANIVIENTQVKSKEVRGVASGTLKVALDDRNLSVVGTMALARGDLELFGRRYVIDRAQLHYDGSTDPMLDVRITHDFPDVTTVTEMRGRLSKPDLVMTSQPSTYSQAELLGFLLGGEPGGDPSQAPSVRERVESSGTSIVASQVGGYVKKALPVDIDVLRYESSTASSSAAVLVGTWITRSLFLAYRHRLEARPDENSAEGEIEYWIRRRLVLQGTVGDRGYNGLDLLWRRRW
jgi:autotransporter translocation and assembly factor TamB